MVALGEPARLLGLVDPDSDLAALVESSGAAVVQLLAWPDRGLAEAFAGTAPAPGGVFRQAEFVDTEWGPRLASSATTWAGVRLERASEVGWSRLLTCMVEHVEVGDDADPLGHRRGRYVAGDLGRRLSPVSGGRGAHPGCDEASASGQRGLGVAAGRDAELVAVRVGEGHPAERLVAAPLDQPGAGREEPVDLGVEVGGGEVEVEPVLARRRVADLLEGQRRPAPPVTSR